MWRLCSSFFARSWSGQRRAGKRSRCGADAMTALVRLSPVPVLRYLCMVVLPKSQAGGLARTGTVCLVIAIHRVLVALQVQATPFLSFMVVPVLGCMSDRDAVVRDVSAAAFAQIVSMLPLEAGAAEPPGFGADLSEKRIQERFFHRAAAGRARPLQLPSSSWVWSKIWRCGRIRRRVWLGWPFWRATSCTACWQTTWAWEKRFRHCVRL